MVSTADIIDIYTEVTDFKKPEDEELNNIYRLPIFAGSSHHGDDGLYFVDTMLADIAAAGDFLNLIREHSFDRGIGRDYENISSGLSDFALDIADVRAQAEGIDRSAYSAILMRAMRMESGPALIADSLNICLRNDVSISGTGSIKVDTAEFGDLDLGATTSDLSSIVFCDCKFDTITLSGIDKNHLPKFDGCQIGELIDIPREWLPNSFFSRNTVQVEVPSALSGRISKELMAPDGVLVLLLCLDRLYDQKGVGRKENAFYRGHDYSSSLVDMLLELLQRHEVAFRGRRRGDHIWYPAKAQRDRVRAIQGNPLTSTDEIVRAARKM